MGELNYNSFNNSFRELVKDGVLNKADLGKLKEIVNSPDLPKNSIDSTIIKLKTDNFVKNYKDTTLFKNYLSRNPETQKIEEISFVFTPTYNEDDKIEGETPFEIVANISQSDALEETKNDGSRCSPSSLLNAYLLMGGKFEDIAKKFEVDTDLTYKNVHLLQDKLYSVGKTNDRKGFSSSITYKVVDKKNHVVPEIGGEVKPLAEKMGMKVRALHGDTLNKEHLRKEAVDNFFKANPNGILEFGVYLDKKSGEVIKGTKTTLNHGVVAFKQDNEFYLANTAILSNGTQKGIKKLSEQEMNDFVYTSEVDVVGLTLNKEK